MIIDCHVHVNRYGDRQAATIANRIDALEISMKRNRVDTALILSSYAVTEQRPSWEELVNITKDKNHLWVVAGLPLESIRKKEWDSLRTHLRTGEVRGLKLYPGYEPFYPFDQELHAVYELAEEFDVPVMIHCGDTYSPRGKLKYSHPIHVDEIAVDFPRVNFVICHLGNPWFVDTMEILYKNKNVFADISGLVLGDFSDRFERYMCKKLEDFLMFGVEPEKVLYGTDWPISSMESYIRFVDGLSIPLSEKTRILFHNSAKLFKLSSIHSLMHQSKERFSLF